MPLVCPTLSPSPVCSQRSRPAPRSTRRCLCGRVWRVPGNASCHTSTAPGMPTMSQTPCALPFPALSRRKQSHPAIADLLLASMPPVPHVGNGGNPRHAACLLRVTPMPLTTPGTPDPPAPARYVKAHAPGCRCGSAAVQCSGGGETRRGGQRVVERLARGVCCSAVGPGSSRWREQGRTRKGDRKTQRGIQLGAGACPWPTHAVSPLPHACTRHAHDNAHTHTYTHTPHTPHPSPPAPARPCSAWAAAHDTP